MKWLKARQWKYELNAESYKAAVEQETPEAFAQCVDEIFPEAKKVRDRAKANGDNDIVDELDKWIETYESQLKATARDAQADESVIDLFVDDVQAAMDELYDIGDAYAIWVKTVA